MIGKRILKLVQQLTGAQLRDDKAQLLATLMLTVGFIIFCLAIVNLAFGVYVPALLEIVFLISCIIPYQLLKKEKTSQAINIYILLTITVTSIATVAAYVQNRFTETENIFFALIMISAILMEERKGIIVSSFIFLLLFAAKMVRHMLENGAINKLLTLTLFNSALVVLVLYLFMIIFKRNLLQYQSKIRNNQRLLYSLIDNVPIWIAMVDKNWRYMMVNSNYEKTFGQHRRDIIGKHIKEILPPDIYEIHAPLLERALKGENVPFNEQTFLPDGNIIYARGSYIPIHNKKGKINAVTVHVDNVTELKRTEELLLQTNQVANVGGWEIDLVKGTVYWSEITRQIHEVEKDFIPNFYNSIRFYCTDDREKMCQAVRNCTERKESWDMELKMLTAQNNIKWIHIKGRGDFKHDTCIRLYGTLQDITEEKRFDEKMEQQNKELAEMTTQLQDSHQMKDRLFSILSHDLRGPLNSLKSILQLVRKDQLTEEEMKILINNLMHDVHKNEQLLNNLLSWSKSQLREHKINKTEFMMNDLVHQNVALFKNELENKRIELKNLMIEQLQVSADKEMISLVVRNLLANAIKFTAMDGVISIQLEADPSQGTTFSIEDTGVGMSSDEMEKVMSNELYSTNGTLNEKGTGLGLNLCLDFLKRNDSELTVKSTVDKGTTFSFTIPFTKSEKAKIADAKKSKPSA